MSDTWYQDEVEDTLANNHKLLGEIMIANDINVRNSEYKIKELKTTNINDMLAAKIEMIKVNRVEVDELEELVLRNQQKYGSMKNPYFYIDLTKLDDKTFDRWKVNYIRHNLTECDLDLYDNKFNRVDSDACNEYRKAVLDKIEDIYPELTNECERQKYSNNKYSYTKA